MSVSRLQMRTERLTPRRKRLPTKSERTRAAILDHALEFLATRQFRDLSVSQLMAPLDVGRSTFYQYFADLHELMETLLVDLEQEIVSLANPWLNDEPEPIDALKASLSELVSVCYERGPILRAVNDAAASDPWLERAWNDFLGRFDEAVAARIRLDQARGLIPPFDAHAMALALNRLDAATLIQAFGRQERTPQAPVREAITRIWISTLYPQAVTERG